MFAQLPALLLIGLASCFLHSASGQGQSLPAQSAIGSSGTGQTALTPEQEALFAQARSAFGAEHWAEAIKKFQTLHAQVPADTTVAKFAAEAEVNGGEPESALALLQPVLQANGADVQALSIAAHAYAQEGKAPQRDAALSQLQTLHDSGRSGLKSVLLERDSAPGGGFVTFFYFFEPWSQYHISLMARQYDGAGKQTRRVTLESGDFDQPGFAKEHPKEAAAGMRAYSLDGYVDQPGTGGSPGTQTHYTYAFFVGRPTYDAFREGVLAIAAGTRSPMSSRSGIPVPAR